MIRPIGIVLIGLLTAVPAFAQVKPEAKIVNVRTGLASGPMAGKEDTYRFESVFKAGHWTPIYVTIEGKGSIVDAELTVQFTDDADVLSDYTIKLPPLDFVSQPVYSFVTYARPGKSEAQIFVHLRLRNQTLASYEANPTMIESNDYLYLTLGARLTRMRPPGADAKTRHVEVGAIDRVSDLPNKWYGYDTADLVIWTTSDPDFTNGVLDNKTKIKALVDWVERGGKLVISIGKNRDLFLDPKRGATSLIEAMLPVTLGEKTTPTKIRVNFSGVADDLTDLQAKTPIDLTKLEIKAGRGAKRLDVSGEPLIVQGAFGFGRVTVVAFDLDQPPFTRWNKQEAFFEKLLREAGPQFVDVEKKDAANSNSFSGTDGDAGDLAAQLQNGCDTFDGVPVISFGWVALFILIYIIVVGPVDYFFLKKVVKRLELTWVTFPLVVLAVSAGAYFTAYALKGDDQKINKLDLIDYDLRTNTARGSSWFTIFSPRIQNYTIGVEPAEGWRATMDRDPSDPDLAIVTWSGKPSGGRKSLFRRTYDYDTENGGLHRVPIQVWSTKGFQSIWNARLDEKALPIDADLSLVAQNKQLRGSVVSHLPVNLEEATLLYKDKSYALGTVMPGKENKKQISASEGQAVSQWVGGAGVQTNSPTYIRHSGNGDFVDPEPARSFIRTLMFHDLVGQDQINRTPRNGGLREFDLSWFLRGDSTGEFAILVGKLLVQKDAAETVMRGHSSPTTLWLGELPGGTAKRPELRGTIRQETYVRMILPVKTSK